MVFTMDRLKREATRLKKAEGIKHAEALDKVSRLHGFENYRHFLKSAEVRNAHAA